MTPSNKGDERLRAEIQEALALLKQGTSTGAALNAKLDEVVRKQDTVPSMLADLERRQNQSLDTLRRDFERMFVSHAEYDPKHQILQDKMKEYDRIIAASMARQEEYATLKSVVKQQGEDIDNLQTRPGSMYSRVLTAVAVGVSILAMLLNFFQHVQIR